MLIGLVVVLVPNVVFVNVVVVTIIMVVYVHDAALNVVVHVAAVVEVMVCVTFGAKKTRPSLRREGSGFMYSKS